MRSLSSQTLDVVVAAPYQEDYTVHTASLSVIHGPGIFTVLKNVCPVIVWEVADSNRCRAEHTDLEHNKFLLYTYSNSGQ